MNITHEKENKKQLSVDLLKVYLIRYFLRSIYLFGILFLAHNLTSRKIKWNQSSKKMLVTLMKLSKLWSAMPLVFIRYLSHQTRRGKKTKWKKNKTLHNVQCVFLFLGFFFVSSLFATTINMLKVRRKEQNDTVCWKHRSRILWLTHAYLVSTCTFSLHLILNGNDVVWQL